MQAQALFNKNDRRGFVSVTKAAMLQVTVTWCDVRVVTCTSE